MVVSVVGEDLRWAEVACETVDGHLRPTATDLAGDAEVLCLLNEVRVRKGRYEVPHYVVEGRSEHVGMALGPARLLSRRWPSCIRPDRGDMPYHP